MPKPKKPGDGRKHYGVVILNLTRGNIYTLGVEYQIWYNWAIYSSVGVLYFDYVYHDIGCFKFRYSNNIYRVIHVK